jgi:hypothetical protein
MYDFKTSRFFANHFRLPLVGIVTDFDKKLLTKELVTQMVLDMPIYKANSDLIFDIDIIDYVIGHKAERYPKTYLLVMFTVNGVKDATKFEIQDVLSTRRNILIDSII